VLDLFNKISDARPLFGDGPHFLVQPSDSQGLPNSIKTIRYVNEPYSDHRSSMMVLDIVRTVREQGTVWFESQNEAAAATGEFASGYFISDITPAGTWTSSQTLVFDLRDGSKANAIVGQGFDNSELPEKTSPALHDLTVGLVSFDRLYVPLSCVAKLHDALGQQVFLDLVNASVFRFINFE